jgi:glycosyltransferase involved in cell wall biosynthesis
MKILLVLDSKRYKSRESSLKEIFGNYEVDFYYTDYENRIIKYFHSLRFAGDFLSHLAYWLLSINYAFRILSRKNRNYSHIVFINPIVGFFYCLLCGHGSRNSRIYLCGLLFVPKRSAFYYNFRKNLLKYALKRVDCLFVYSSGEIRIYSELFPEIMDRIKFIRYGRDFDIFRDAEFKPEKKYIASGGISNRDYDTLLGSMRILHPRYPELICKVATRPGSFMNVSKPQNLEFIYTIRIGQFGSFLENSEFMVLPLNKTALSAGHMTLLEAMSYGKIIIVSDIPAVRDYVDENLVYFYEPSNINDLAQKIEFISACMGSDRDICDKASKCTSRYREEFTFSSFLKRILMELDKNEVR